MAFFEIQNHENENVHAVMVVVALGVLAFFAVSSVFFFKNKLFQSIFFKYRSFAAEEQLIPKVDLKVEYQGEKSDGVVNIPNEGFSIKLTWATLGNPTKCIGRSWGIYDQDKTWDGEKDVNGGSFTSIRLEKNNPYVYSIDCSNEYGDAIGDSVTLNVGAKDLNLAPFITSLNEEGKGVRKDPSAPIILENTSQLKVRWSGVNLSTPYSICLTSGSWPINYQSPGNNSYIENLNIEDEKIHKFTIYCSNESSFTKDSLTILKK